MGMIKIIDLDFITVNAGAYRHKIHGVFSCAVAGKTKSTTILFLLQGSVSHSWQVAATIASSEEKKKSLSKSWYSMNLRENEKSRTIDKNVFNPPAT